MNLCDLIKLQGKIVNVKGYNSPCKIVFDENMSSFMLENLDKTRIFLYKEEHNLDKNYLSQLINNTNTQNIINDEINALNDKWDYLNKKTNDNIDYELER